MNNLFLLSKDHQQEKTFATVPRADKYNYGVAEDLKSYCWRAEHLFVCASCCPTLNLSEEIFISFGDTDVGAGDVGDDDVGDNVMLVTLWWPQFQDVAESSVANISNLSPISMSPH